MIQLQRASLEYEDHGRRVFACRNVDLEIQPGEFVGILGPSGSGKSSLLYLLSGLKTPTSGQALLDGQDLATQTDAERARIRRSDIGFVFQHPFLIGYLTVFENVVATNPGQASRVRAKELLEQLGVADKAERFPHELSGGEKQRVVVARALAHRPRVIFADEPTAALDHTNGAAVVSLLAEHRGEGSLVMVTHDASMLEKADRVISISDGTIISA